MSVREIRLEWTGQREAPSLANLGDVLKTIQTIFNLIYGARSSLKVREINTIDENEFSTIVESELLEPALEAIIEQMTQIWDSFRADDIRGVLAQLNIPPQAIQILEINGFDFNSLLDDDCFRVLQPDIIRQLENVFPNFRGIPTKLRHINRAKTWRVY